MLPANSLSNTARVLSPTTSLFDTDGSCAERTSRRVSFRLETIANLFPVFSSHLVYAESMKQMYKLADTITPDEVNNFAIYCYCFTQVRPIATSPSPMLTITFRASHTTTTWKKKFSVRTLSYIDPYPPNVLLVPKLEPELKTPVSEEHATFERFLNELNTYLQGILQVKQGKTYGQLVPDADRAKEEYDPAKLKGILETLVSPLLKHVSRLIVVFGCCCCC
jgi:hypothetical protein